MISRFFIDRPIFASVLSIVVVLAGLVALLELPVAQFPDVAPPTVVVSASYPGANARTVRDTVAAPIEQQISGVENMLSMSSVCTNDGAYTLTISFALGTDADMAQVLVQNRVSLALPVVPDVVQRQGISVQKVSPSTLLIVNLVATGAGPAGAEGDDELYLSNYATIQVRDQLARVEGVGGVEYFGRRDYSMRVWIDPDRLAAVGLTTSDVIAAIESQNTQVAAGQLGAEPMAPGQQFQLTVEALGRLTEPEAFGAIIVKSTTGEPSAFERPEQPTAGLVRLRDVARVELGAQQYGQSCTLDGKPSVALTIHPLPGANALRTAEAVLARMEELSGRFPPGIEYRVVYDTTPFVKESILEVFRTLRDAIILVALVVMLFLQSWRAALIPLVAAPVALVGTFAVMAVLGFSLNNLSLFGLVLAIGIVVDDAIVVVEIVERWLEEGLEPREAARRAMDEVTGPILAIALVLSAVFLPAALIPGVTGAFLRQFAVTIAVSTLLSAFNSLTLSPALAALLLRPRGGRRDPLTRVIDFAFGWFFRLFNRAFETAAGGYVSIVGLLLRGSALVVLLYAGLLVFTGFELDRAPKGFVPEQDKGYLLVNVELPEAASVQRTRDAMRRIERTILETPGVAHTVGISGRSILLNANAPNVGSFYAMLEPFEKRRDLPAVRVADEIRARCADDLEATVSVFGAPPIDGVGATGGFRFVVQDRDSLGEAELRRVSGAVVSAVAELPQVTDVFDGTSGTTTWLRIDVDRTKCESLGISLAQVVQTLQVSLGSYYVDNFNAFGRTWQVNVMAEADFRRIAADVVRLQVRGRGGMVPLATLVSMEEMTGPVMLMRYDMYAASAISGGFARGASSGDAATAIERTVEPLLPRSMAFAWTDLIALQQQAGSAAIVAFVLAVVFVFLVLAAQYESWRLPMAVILVAPLCLLCAVLGITIAGYSVDLFTQTGFIVLVGLASKNAILIVEFAKQRLESGASRRDATLQACRLRIRPILMTSFAFILGVVPLLLAEGAGAEMRRSLGTAVFWGMIGVTTFGVLLTPVFFSVVSRGMRQRAVHPTSDAAARELPAAPAEK